MESVARVRPRGSGACAAMFGMRRDFAVGNAVAGEARVRENDRRYGLRFRPCLQWSVRF
jgi:hypothetical protein